MKAGNIMAIASLDDFWPSYIFIKLCFNAPNFIFLFKMSSFWWKLLDLKCNISFNKKKNEISSCQIFDSWCRLCFSYKYEHLKFCQFLDFSMHWGTFEFLEIVFKGFLKSLMHCLQEVTEACKKRLMSQ